MIIIFLTERYNAGVTITSGNGKQIRSRTLTWNVEKHSKKRTVHRTS